MNRRPLIFVGSRVMMLELASIAELNNIEILGILDHHYFGNQDSICGIPIIGDERQLLNSNNPEMKQLLRTCDFFPANWHNGEQKNRNRPSGHDLRINRINLLDRSGASVINLIHPSSSVAHHHLLKYKDYQIGRGVFIDANVHHSVCNVKIGDYSAFMAGNICGHDVTVGRNVLVAGSTHLFDCTINDNAFIGIYSHINPYYKKGAISIGKNATIWHSATVKKDVPDNCMYTTTGRILKKST